MPQCQCSLQQLGWVGEGSEVSTAQKSSFAVCRINVLSGPGPTVKVNKVTLATLLPSPIIISLTLLYDEMAQMDIFIFYDFNSCSNQLKLV